MDSLIAESGLPVPSAPLVAVCGPCVPGSQLGTQALERWLRRWGVGLAALRRVDLPRPAIELLSPALPGRSSPLDPQGSLTSGALSSSGDALRLD